MKTKVTLFVFLAIHVHHIILLRPKSFSNNFKNSPKTKKESALSSPRVFLYHIVGINFNPKTEKVLIVSEKVLVEVFAIFVNIHSSLLSHLPFSIKSLVMVLYSNS